MRLISRGGTAEWLSITGSEATASAVLVAGVAGSAGRAAGEERARARAWARAEGACRGRVQRALGVQPASHVQG